MNAKSLKKTTLGALIPNGIVTFMTLSHLEHLRNEKLPIYVLIGSEVVKITAINWTTGVCTIVRGAFSSIPTAHARRSVVTSDNFVERK